MKVIVKKNLVRKFCDIPHNITPPTPHICGCYNLYIIIQKKATYIIVVIDIAFEYLLLVVGG